MEFYPLNHPKNTKEIQVTHNHRFQIISYAIFSVRLAVNRPDSPRSTFMLDS